MKRNLDDQIRKLQAFDWDAVGLVMSKGNQFTNNLKAEHARLFKRGSKLIDQLIDFNQFKLLQPKSVSKDFKSHMATAYQWVNGVVVPIETFSKDSLEFITPKLERRPPYDALNAYMFYIVEMEGPYRTQLIRMITNQPARLLVAFNMATHSGAANRDRQRVMHTKPLVDLIAKDMTGRPECMVMLQQASDEDCFADGGK